MGDNWTAEWYRHLEKLIDRSDNSPNLFQEIDKVTLKELERLRKEDKLKGVWSPRFAGVWPKLLDPALTSPTPNKYNKASNKQTPTNDNTPQTNGVVQEGGGGEGKAKGTWDFWWLKRKAEQEDGGFVSAGGWVTDLAQAGGYQQVKPHRVELITAQVERIKHELAALEKMLEPLLAEERK